MVDDHEDYETGAAPAAHKISHQDGGTDEISVAGLAGVPAQLAAHALLPSIHHLRYTDVEAAAAAAALILIHKNQAVAHQDAPQLILDHKGDAVAHQDAPQLILDHKGDASAHHARYTDGDAEAVADVQIGIHALLSTVHQDAPDLIFTHKGDVSAHHAKYTDGEARASHSPMAIPPSAFGPAHDTDDFIRYAEFYKARVSLSIHYCQAPLIFPPGVTITKITLYGYRNLAASNLALYLRRINRVGGVSAMATVTANWTDGYGSHYDDSISYSIIDNANYSYGLQLNLDCSLDVDELKFTGAEIEFTG